MQMTLIPVINCLLSPASQNGQIAQTLSSRFFVLDLRRLVLFTSCVASLDVSSDWNIFATFRVKVPVNFRVNFK